MAARYVAFIIRMRLDEAGTGAAGEPAVRGSLQQVGQDEVHYFSSFEQALVLLKGKLPQSPAEAGQD